VILVTCDEFYNEFQIANPSLSDYVNSQKEKRKRKSGKREKGKYSRV
jgi:hypothetical protein